MRELALSHFLETVLDDNFFVDKDFCSLELHHASSGERVEIISSDTYDQVMHLEGLKREVELFFENGFYAPVVLYDVVNYPSFVTILNWTGKEIPNTNQWVYYLLAADWGVFLRGKIERLMIA